MTTLRINFQFPWNKEKCQAWLARRVAAGQWTSWVLMLMDDHYGWVGILYR